MKDVIRKFIIDASLTSAKYNVKNATESKLSKSKRTYKRRKLLSHAVYI